MLIDAKVKFRTWDDFKTLFLGAWGDSQLKQTAHDALRNLRQTGRCTHYATNFMHHASQTGYKDSALMEMFYEGLKPEVKDLLLTMPEADSLTDLHEKAIRADQRAFRRKQEKKRLPTSFPPTYDKSAAPTFPPTTASSSSGPMPMDLDQIVMKPSQPRGPLTSEEKKRRECENLCRYCGDGSCPGVPDVEQCPRLVQKNAGKVPRRA